MTNDWIDHLEEEYATFHCGDCGTKKMIKTNTPFRCKCKRLLIVKVSTKVEIKEITKRSKTI